MCINKASTNKLGFNKESFKSLNEQTKCEIHGNIWSAKSLKLILFALPC